MCCEISATDALGDRATAAVVEEDEIVVVGVDVPVVVVLGVEMAAEGEVTCCRLGAIVAFLIL